MRTLYHYPVCPFSRKIRLILAEKKLDFTAEIERFWEMRPEFVQMNPASQVPILVDLNGTVICDSMAIGEYIEEAYTDRSLLGEGLSQRAEVRRLMAWFENKLYSESTFILLSEKHLKRYTNSSASMGPNSPLIRQAQNAVHPHLDYISWLADRRKWLAGEELSIADLTAAAQLSVIDYFGDVPWDKHPVAKEWYMRIKSRPSFRSLLQDRVPAAAPALHYPNLDF